METTIQKIYDADAPQRVPMVLIFGGECHDVTFKFKPLDDESAITFIDAEGESFGSAQMFAKFIESAEGAESDEGEPFTPTELAELVPVEDQRYAVDGALLGTRLLPLPKASKKLNWRNPPSTSHYKLAAYFDGAEVIVQHTLDTPSNEHRRVFEALEKKAFPITFGDHQIRSYGRGLVALYDAMNAAGTDVLNGYKDRIPAHHKMVVVTAHLRGQREILLGK